MFRNIKRKIFTDTLLDSEEGILKIYGYGEYFVR
jgi:hypothetical protein